MKLHIPWENDGVRLLMTIEPKSLVTHSLMQSLTDEDKTEISELGKDALARLSELIRFATENVPKSDMAE